MQATCVLDAEVCTVRPCTQGKYEGVHAFAVRIRDDNLNVLPNIRIKVSTAPPSFAPLFA